MCLNEDLVDFFPRPLCCIGNVGKHKLQFINEDFYFCEGEVPPYLFNICKTLKGANLLNRKKPRITSLNLKLINLIKLNMNFSLKMVMIYI